MSLNPLLNGAGRPTPENSFLAKPFAVLSQSPAERGGSADTNRFWWWKPQALSQSPAERGGSADPGNWIRSGRPRVSIPC